MKRLLFLLSLALTPFVGSQAEPLVLDKDDHICLIGNTLPERMQHFGYFETLLHARFSGHQFVVRNLGFSADELGLRSRSLNFGDANHHLTKEKADVILAFFGLNESFDGEDGLERFAAQLDSFIKDTLGKKYNGKTAPRLAIVSPIAYEGGGGRPSDREVNRQLSLYIGIRSIHLLFR